MVVSSRTNSFMRLEAYDRRCSVQGTSALRARRMAFISARHLPNESMQSLEYEPQRAMESITTSRLWLRIWCGSLMAACSGRYRSMCRRQGGRCSASSLHAPGTLPSIHACINRRSARVGISAAKLRLKLLCHRSSDIGIRPTKRAPSTSSAYIYRNAVVQHGGVVDEALYEGATPTRLDAVILEVSASLIRLDLVSSYALVVHAEPANRGSAGSD